MKSHTPLAASLEASLAARVAGLLTRQALDLPHDIAERLRFAREQALGRAREEGLQAAATAPAAQRAGGTVVYANAGHAATLSPPPRGWLQAASALPLLVLVLGLVLIDHWVSSERVQSAAEMDAQLLAEDLPPAAYTDPGFAEYLRDGPPQ